LLIVSNTDGSAFLKTKHKCGNNTRMNTRINTVVFDLDGTISDPAQGITRSINHALVELGRAPFPEKNLEKYIGPHLHIIFSNLMETTNTELLDRAVAHYRERYLSIGYQENELYDGMKSVLEQLLAGGSKLCIATAKRRATAVKVLRYLGIDDLFHQIHGCGLHQPKSELLQAIVSDVELEAYPMVMIGDRDSDFRAASEVGMPSIAVRWGFGSEEEYKAASDIVDMPVQLYDAIARTARPI
jgi:phosphoglycolate phosphatase